METSQPALIFSRPLRLGMRPAKLRFAFPLPQPPPEQTQPPPQGGLAFPSESREDSFTPSPAGGAPAGQSPVQV